jgi:alcohol dehydrogenase (cytochrome c)
LRLHLKHLKFVIVVLVTLLTGSSASFAVISTTFAGSNAARGFGSQQQINANYPWDFPGQNQQNTWNSPQTEINPNNVANLTLLWRAYIPHVYGSVDVVNHVVYANVGGYAGVGENGGIVALNETTGYIIWYDNFSNTGVNFTTRGGVEIYNGSIFAGTQDNKLVSINAQTGSIGWETSITQGISGNPVGYYIGPSGTPLAFNGEVIIADTQGDIGARGFIRAFNASNGNLIWTWYVVPPSPITSSDQSAWGNTWGNCQYCGGGDIWNLPALNYSNGIIYFGTGNPAPDYNASERSPIPSDTNLYTDSIVALNATSGQLLWYYQENQAEAHDWDQGMPVMIFYTHINRTNTEVLAAGGKDGYFFELNAKTGQLYYKVPLGIHLNSDAPPTPSGTIVYPGSFGGVNSYSSYDPFTDMVYMMVYNQPSNYTIAPIDPQSDITGSLDNPLPSYGNNCTLYAIDASTGSVEWSMNLPGLGGGVSSTNNLVFTSDANGVFYALDAQTGKVLWSYYTGADEYLGIVSRTPPAVTDGILFETLYGSSDGGVMAFTTNTSVYYSTGDSTSSLATSSSSRVFVSNSTTTSATIIKNASSTFSATLRNSSTLTSSSSTRGTPSSIPTSLAIEIVAIALVGIGSSSALFLRRRR